MGQIDTREIAFKENIQQNKIRFFFIERGVSAVIDEYSSRAYSDILFCMESISSTSLMKRQVISDSLVFTRGVDKNSRTEVCPDTRSVIFSTSSARLTASSMIKLSLKIRMEMALIFN